jgi:glycosyltransferase involved in cell wall biosynthesis
VEILQRVIADYPNRAPKIRIIRKENNSGIAVVRNTLIEACNTDFLFFLDSDDWITPNAIELLVKCQKKTGADIISGQVLDCTEEGESPYKSLGTDLDKKKTLVGILTNQSISPILCSRLIRTTLFKQHAVYFDEKINHMEDFSVTPRLFYYTKSISSIPDFIYHYNRQNTHSYTYNYEKDWNYQQQSLNAYEINLLFFSSKEPEYKKALEMSMFNKYRHMLFLSVQNNNRAGFDYCRNYLQEHKSLYNRISKGKIIHLIESSYFLMRITNRIRLQRAILLSKF